MVTAILNPEVVCLNLFQKEIIPEEIKQNILEAEENDIAYVRLTTCEIK